MKKTLIIIGGPTAVGKTKLAIKLAQKFQSEIISADSRQFYKELNIGVAKPSKLDISKIPHHFIGHKSIHHNYSVAEYEQDALLSINKLFKKKDILFVCGGSGLYIDALCEGLHQFPEVKNKVRQNLEKDLQKKGLITLITELKKNDPTTYKKIDTKNPRRVIRALEIYRSSGKPYSFYLQKKKKKRNFNSLFFALQKNREKLYTLINARVETMINDGLLTEVKSLYPYKDKKALQTIGYQEIFKYLDQKTTITEAIEEIKKNTRRYAKRQITWFKQKKYHQIHKDQEVFELISQLI